MQSPTCPDLLVAHPVALLAAGLASALAPRATLLDHAALGPLIHQPATGVLVTDLQLALTVLSQSRPQPGRTWQPWRCVVVSLDARCWQMRQALQQGVLAVVQAGCTLDELWRAVAAARAGQRFVCSAIAAHMAEASLVEPLTPRETEVLQQLCRGLDNKSIALRLDMALGTVKTHVKAILEKLGASSRTQAVAAAHQRGLARPAEVSLSARWPAGDVAAEAPPMRPSGIPGVRALQASWAENPEGMLKAR